MLISHKRRARFSLLTCLEHGELSFGSHAATFHPTPEHAELFLGDAGLRAGSAILGRLMVGSRSLTFEPDEAELPLVRMLLRDVPRPLFEWAASTHEVIGAAAGAGGFEVLVKALATRTERFQPLRLVRLASQSAQLLRFSHTTGI